MQDPEIDASSLYSQTAWTLLLKMYLIDFQDRSRKCNWAVLVVPWDNIDVYGSHCLIVDLKISFFLPALPY